jgi:hypothetical protein
MATDHYTALSGSLGIGGQPEEHAAVIPAGAFSIDAGSNQKVDWECKGCVYDASTHERIEPICLKAPQAIHPPLHPNARMWIDV